MSRITQKQLTLLVARLNLVTNSPSESWVKDANGKFRAQIGNYHLDGAYGGLALHRMQNESGAITDVLEVGHVSKREIYNLIHAYIRGLEVQS